MQAIYVYGSATTSNLTKRSDLDVAIKGEQPLDNVTRWEIQEKLAMSINRDVDLLDMNRASLVMRFEVVSTGIRVFCLEDYDIESYETLIYSQYLDFNEIRKPIIAAILERGSVYARG